MAERGAAERRRGRAQRAERSTAERSAAHPRRPPKPASWDHRIRWDYVLQAGARLTTDADGDAFYYLARHPEAPTTDAEDTDPLQRRHLAPPIDESFGEPTPPPRRRPRVGGTPPPAPADPPRRVRALQDRARELRDRQRHRQLHRGEDAGDGRTNAPHYTTSGGRRSTPTHRPHPLTRRRRSKCARARPTSAQGPRKYGP